MPAHSLSVSSPQGSSAALAAPAGRRSRRSCAGRARPTVPSGPESIFEVAVDRQEIAREDAEARTAPGIDLDRFQVGRDPISSGSEPRQTTCSPCHWPIARCRTSERVHDASGAGAHHAIGAEGIVQVDEDVTDAAVEDEADILIASERISNGDFERAPIARVTVRCLAHGAGDVGRLSQFAAGVSRSRSKRTQRTAPFQFAGDAVR